MRVSLPLVALVAACEGSTSAPTPSVLPSLHGVLVVTASDHGSPSVIDRIGESANPDCVADAYGGIELVADVAPNPGEETILASFSQGVVVLAADGQRIASIPGFDCTGSQDDLVAVEIVRTSFDAPVIAVAASQGGRRESSTWLELLAVGTSDHLDRLFMGEIERNDDQGTHTGDVTMVPGGLVYRHPIDGVSLWKYDVVSHRYVMWRSVERPRSETRRAPTVD